VAQTFSAEKVAVEAGVPSERVDWRLTVLKGITDPVLLFRVKVRGE
jgi:hypothetical protein